MSYIIRTGSLAAVSELHQGANGSYAYALIIVSDPVRQEDGRYTSGPAISYDVVVTGRQAVALIETAKACGNVRITFAGHYRVTERRDARGAVGVQHVVRAEEVAVSLREQAVTAKTTTRHERAGQKVLL